MLDIDLGPLGGRRASSVLAIVALLAWARNDPGVDDRDPRPASDAVAVAPVTGVDDADPYADDVGAGRSTMDDAAGATVAGPRPPSFLDALIPVVVLIVLLDADDRAVRHRRDRTDRCRWRC